MRKLCLYLVLGFYFIARASAQTPVVQPATTGMVAQVASGSGVPGTYLACNAAAKNLLFLNSLTMQESWCDGTTWQPVADAPAIASIPFSALVNEPANTVLGNFSGTAAAPSANVISGCSGTPNALNYTTNSGFTCNTSITANQLALLTTGGVPYGTGPTTSSAIPSPTTTGKYVLMWQPSGTAVTPQAVNANTLATTVNGLPCALTGSCTIPVPQFSLNGTLQANVKCGFYTGTTSAAGSATVNYSALGLTTVFGPPNVSVLNTAVSFGQTTAYSTTSATVLTQGGTVISLVGVNILSLSGSAMPYGLFVCGV